MASPDAALKAAAEKAGVNPTELKAAFPNGAASLVEAFSHWADDRMAERMREAHVRAHCASAWLRP